jgi:hypothetical protein
MPRPNSRRRRSFRLRRRRLHRSLGCRRCREACTQRRRRPRRRPRRSRLRPNANVELEAPAPTRASAGYRLCRCGPGLHSDSLLPRGPPPRVNVPVGPECLTTASEWASTARNPLSWTGAGYPPTTAHRSGAREGAVAESVSSRTPTSRSRFATAGHPGRVRESLLAAVCVANDIRAGRRSRRRVRGPRHAPP